MNGNDISQLVGKTLSSVVNKDDCEILFTTVDGRIFRLYHGQDCCESVSVEDICGELNDLVGSPILQAEESSSHTNPVGYVRTYPPESFTWTFYRLATTKGSVVIRWLGESNGFYSEGVDFEEIKEAA